MEKKDWVYSNGRRNHHKMPLSIPRKGKQAKYYRSKKHYTALSVARLAKYAQANGESRCKIIALVLYSLGLGDLACRALKYIGLFDLIVPTATIVMDAFGAFMLVWGTIALAFEIIAVDTTIIVLDAIIALLTVIESLPVTLTITEVIILVVNIKLFIDAIKTPLSIIKNIIKQANWDSVYQAWYDDVQKLQDVALTVKDLECVCKAYQLITNHEKVELNKKIPRNRTFNHVKH